ncbi:MAG: hypothetical protein JKY24_07235, partial [Pseudomonadales bacterium]|nr:hypothetical protein [Pseudomonadales bacterium]
MKWIRWQGLVAFIVIMSLTVGFAWYMAGGLIKGAIESFGSEAAGAK